MVDGGWRVVGVGGGWWWWVAVWVVLVAHRIFVSAKVPLGLIRVLNWVGVGLRGFED